MTIEEILDYDLVKLEAMSNIELEEFCKDMLISTRPKEVAGVARAVGAKPTTKLGINKDALLTLQIQAILGNKK